MRLDLGPDGKIIGTRRVSPNGQVSGLSEFSGREVLVILPGSAESGAGPSWPNADEVARMVGDQIRQAYDRYRALQDAYASPWEATRSFMEAMSAAPFPDLMAEVDRWIRSQVRHSPPHDPTSPPASSPPPSKHPARSSRRAPNSKASSARRRRA